MKLFFLLGLLFSMTIQAEPSCIPLSEAKLAAQDAIQEHLDLEPRYKLNDPTLRQVVSLIQNLKIIRYNNGMFYSSSVDFADDHLAWVAHVNCDGKAWFGVRGNSYDSPFAD